MKIGCKFVAAVIASLAPGVYVAAAGAGPDTAARSSDSSGEGLQEIIVTAEKRSSNLQTTPIAITAFSGEQLAKEGVRTLTDMQWVVPNFQMGENDGYAQITIRGIGVSDFVPTAEGAVAVNQNEVYVSRPIAQLGSFFDVGSLEVLRGPQGTLYGRNATAGSVNFTTARPTNEWSGYVRGAVGNYSATTLEGAAGGPIIDDVLLIRVAGIIDKHAGYGKNLVTGTDLNDKNAWGARVTVVYTPTSSITGTFIAEHYNEDDRAAALHYFGPAQQTGLVGSLGIPPAFIQSGGYAASNLQDIAAPRDPKFFLRTTALTGIFEYRFDPFSVKSITAYREQDSLTFTPLGGGSTADAFFIAGEPAHQISEELQLHYDSSRLHATGGLFWFKERDASTPGSSPFDGHLLDAAFGLPLRNPDYVVDFVEIGGTIRTEAKAAFTQATYEIIDRLSLTAGIRYSEETKEADLVNGFSLFQPYISTTPYQNDTPLPPVTHEPLVKFKSTTPKAGVQYQIDANNMVYFTFSKGFKSGGYDVTTVSPAFQPEKLTAYEVGSKSDLLNKRLRVNLSAFWYDYSNLQVLQVVGPAVFTSNAGSAHVYGVESEFDALVTDAFKVHAAATWLHARYQQYVGPDPARPLFPTVDFSGNALNNAPSFKMDLAPEYTWHMQSGTLALRGQATYSSRFYFGPANIDLLSQGSYVKLNAFLTFTSKKNYDVTAFVRNLTDKTTRTSGVINTPILSTAQGAVAPPRTFGVEASFHW
jgi:iron complex outermembrane receptor protein